MGRVTPDAILDALDPEQRAVAEALQGPVCVLAGAGTGKTRAITHRLAYGVSSNVWSPRSVLAVTFTARAAGEMRGRLRQLGVSGVQARTFHSAALRQLTLLLAARRRGRDPAHQRAQGRADRRGGWTRCACRRARPRCATSRPRSSGPR